VKVWVGYEELSGGCSVLDLARAEAAFWSHLAASFLKCIVLEKALAISGATNDASKSTLLAGFSLKCRARHGAPTSSSQRQPSRPDIQSSILAVLRKTPVRECF
jgi:hypothetical protein